MYDLVLLLFVGLNYRYIIRNLGGVRDLMFCGFRCGFLRFFSLGSRFFRIVRLVSFDSFFILFIINYYLININTLLFIVLHSHQKYEVCSI
jgi:hypothetical protein